MTLKRKAILVSLDVIFILLVLVELGVISLIIAYDTNSTMKYLFGFIGIICSISAYKSIVSIKKGEI